MNKKQLTTIFLSLCFFLAHSETTANAKDKENFQGEMSFLSEAYFKLEKLSKNPKQNQSPILENIKLMQDILKNISSVNKDKNLTKPLQTLSYKIKDLKKTSAADEPEKFQKNLNQIYSTCFSCHFTHWGTDY